MLLAGLLADCYSQTTLFDAGWRFHRGGWQRAEAPETNDSSWRQVDLPHDWSIEDIPGTGSPFAHDAISQVSGGYTVGGTGWYRKSFTIPEADTNKKVLIQFDGSYMNTDVWLNGRHIGNHAYGYTSFWFDMTDYVKFGENNVIAVQVKNEGQNSRWYSGSGIYRHVWLKITEPVHISQWGIGITTPDVNPSRATVRIKTRVLNEASEPASIILVTNILDKGHIRVARARSEYTLEPGKEVLFDQDAAVLNPELWSPDSPDLYTAVSEVYCEGRLVDHSETRFGIRSIEFSAEKGFLLNGLPIELKGGCVHHDNGPLGSRAYDRAEERRVELLKASGFNAVRCAHNPPSPAFLDACDRLGMMVIDEAFDMWRIGNNPYDYHLYFDQNWQSDIESFVKRDVNHPSVIMWSIGNEIKEMENPEVIAVEKMLAERVRSLDPTRPVTAAVNQLRPEKDPYFANLDICGYNYAASGDHGVANIYVSDHERIPSRVMVGTESYPLAAYYAWMPVIDNTYVIGDFVWTAFDYIGEASIGWLGYWQEDFYPWNLAYCGDIDICGWKRPQSYYRDVLWKKNQLSVFVTPPTPSFPVNPKKESWSIWEWYDVIDDWTWTGMENKLMKVSVYSSCEKVELFLNGKSLGKKETNRMTEFKALWEVPYIAGELKAVGFEGKKKVATSLIRTSGEVTSMRLLPDRYEISADGQDLSYVTVELTDSDGLRNQKDERLIRFSIKGEGTIIGVGNANPVSTESNQLPQRKAWKGRCLVIIKSSGKPGQIRLTASADGLPPASLTITAR